MKKLNLIDKAFHLKKTVLFGSLDLDLLLPIADKLGIADFDIDDVIFNINEQANRMYLLVKGTIEIQDPDGNFLASLREGEFFGEEAIFNEKPRGYKAICKSDAQLLSLSRTHILTIISECPAVAIAFLQVYTSFVTFRPRKIVENE